MHARIAALLVLLFVSHFASPVEAAGRTDRRSCYASADDHRYPCGGGNDLTGRSFGAEPILPRAPRRAAPRRSSGFDTNSRACLPGSITRKLDSLEARFGKLKIIATRAHRPRLNTGEPSAHETCQAVDLMPARGRYAAVLADLRATWPGTVLTYSGALHHIHFDTRPGRYRGHIVADHVHEEAPAQTAERSKSEPESSQSKPEPYKLASAMPAEPLLEERPAAIDPAPAVVPELSPRELAVADARAYLKKIAGFGGTMARQGRDSVMARLKASLQEPDIFAAFRTALASGQVREEGIGVSIDRLHPDYALKLAAAVKEARSGGLPDAGPFSCYRPPEYRIGGMRDKAASCHAYGLVCDIGGIGRAGSSESRLWARYATRAGLYRPWRASWEHNHWQLVPHRVCGTAALRRTITPAGPKDLKAMWAGGSRLLAQAEAYALAEKASSSRRQVKKRRHHTRLASR